MSCEKSSSMTPDQRRLAFHLAPLSAVAIGLSVLACGAISARRLDHIYLLYVIGALGLAAGFFQWRSRGQIIAKSQAPARNTFSVQVYGMVALTALCSVLGVLVGRAVGGVDLMTGN
jgi:hypothetical protein